MLAEVLGGTVVASDDFTLRGKRKKDAFVEMLLQTDPTAPYVLVDKISTQRIHREEICENLPARKRARVLIDLQAPPEASVDLAIDRILKRGGHPSLVPSRDLPGVLTRTQKGLEPVTPAELKNLDIDRRIVLDPSAGLERNAGIVLEQFCQMGLLENAVTLGLVRWQQEFLKSKLETSVAASPYPAATNVSLSSLEGSSASPTTAAAPTPSNATAAVGTDEKAGAAGDNSTSAVSSTPQPIQLSRFAPSFLSAPIRRPVSVLPPVVANVITQKAKEALFKTPKLPSPSWEPGSGKGTFSPDTPLRPYVSLPSFPARLKQDARILLSPSLEALGRTLAAGAIDTVQQASVLRPLLDLYSCDKAFLHMKSLFQQEIGRLVRSGYQQQQQQMLQQQQKEKERAREQQSQRQNGEAATGTGGGVYNPYASSSSSSSSSALAAKDAREVAGETGRQSESGGEEVMWRAAVMGTQRLLPSLRQLIRRLEDALIVLGPVDWSPSQSEEGGKKDLFGDGPDGSEGRLSAAYAGWAEAAVEVGGGQREGAGLTVGELFRRETAGRFDSFMGENAAGFLGATYSEEDRLGFRVVRLLSEISSSLGFFHRELSETSATLQRLEEGVEAALSSFSEDGSEDDDLVKMWKEQKDWAGSTRELVKRELSLVESTMKKVMGFAILNISFYADLTFEDFHQMEFHDDTLESSEVVRRALLFQDPGVSEDMRKQKEGEEREKVRESYDLKPRSGVYEVNRAEARRFLQALLAWKDLFRTAPVYRQLVGRLVATALPVRPSQDPISSTGSLSPIFGLPFAPFTGEAVSPSASESASSSSSPPSPGLDGTLELQQTLWRSLMGLDRQNAETTRKSLLKKLQQLKVEEKEKLKKGDGAGAVEGKGKETAGNEAGGVGGAGDVLSSSFSLDKNDLELLDWICEIVSEQRRFISKALTAGKIRKGRAALAQASLQQLLALALRRVVWRPMPNAAEIQNPALLVSSIKRAVFRLLAIYRPPSASYRQGTEGAEGEGAAVAADSEEGGGSAYGQVNGMIRTLVKKLLDFLGTLPMQDNDAASVAMALRAAHKKGIDSFALARLLAAAVGRQERERALAAGGSAVGGTGSASAGRAKFDLSEVAQVLTHYFPPPEVVFLPPAQGGAPSPSKISSAAAAATGEIDALTALLDAPWKQGGSANSGGGTGGPNRDSRGSRRSGESEGSPRGFERQRKPQQQQQQQGVRRTFPFPQLPGPTPPGGGRPPRSSKSKQQQKRPSS
uniref:Uncharacterized protein n=1 Tax=Chromera velia CCMP2878 TaxID=1169474 RepID=A0A0G4HK91_9ALVE|eukprot:Cvel_1106.t1-p1 / transcript=Cvel_1106.t1 / gene=Cvel_1106 / organism=Chromera_velia_CCMP2878 / gene_product=hypothetical protein / transcript_product=hypothetical protein / location=Cvel_scaffold36:59732-68120(-) / protein_length=1254 / sequence_SO=supercontig / SO=protein_coding / is_pseudo=false